MKYYIAKVGSVVVGKHFGRKETFRREFPDAKIFEVEQDVYDAIRVGDEY
jgi:hypothetical protein